jgi:hypothetical protein
MSSYMVPANLADYGASKAGLIVLHEVRFFLLPLFGYSLYGLFSPFSEVY